MFNSVFINRKNPCSNFFNYCVDARGTLVILDNKQRLIEYAVIDQDDLEAIVCSAELTLDLDEKPIALSEFDKTLAPKKTIFFNGLFEPISLSHDKLDRKSVV